MKKIAFISSFYNPVKFKVPVKNCYNFLKYNIGTKIPIDDFFFGQIENEVKLDIKGLMNKENYLKLKSDSAIWHKERILNLLIQKFDLIDRYEYICWLDCDIIFEKPVIIPDNFEMVAFQPFKYSFRSKCPRNIDYSKPFHMDGEKLESFGYNKTDGDIGLCWAINSEYLDEIGGLFDYGIVGGGDYYFTKRILGEEVHTGCIEFNKSINEYVDGSFLSKKEIGYLDNNIYHQFHGKISNRAYDDRIKILRKYEYDPLKHLKISKNLLYELKNKDFEEEIKQFFIGRKEDENS